MYLAPELILEEEERKKINIDGEKTDIWALGITFYEILCGRTPYEDALNIYQLYSLINERQIDFNLIKNEEAKEVI